MRLRGFGSVRKRRNRGWQICYYVHGEEVRESVAKILGRPPAMVTKEDARELLKQRIGELQSGRYFRPKGTPLTVAGALDNYIGHLRLEGAKSVSKVESVARCIVAELGDGPARDLTAPAIKRWAEALQRKGLKPGTVQQRCAHLGAALRLAHREQLLGAVPAFPTIRLSNARQGFFEREEFERVIAALPPEVADVAWFGYLTGWRKTEILGLTWAWIDRQRRELRLPDSKNGDAQVLPLVGELWPLIERRWAARVVGDAITSWVFHRAGRQIRDFRAAWVRACKKAGVPGRLFHDFRRTAARDLVEAGNDYRAAMSVTGHRSLSVFMRYRIVDRGTTARALERMQAHRAATNTDTFRGHTVVSLT